jgi:hypothetical protein
MGLFTCPSCLVAGGEDFTIGTQPQPGTPGAGDGATAKEQKLSRHSTVGGRSMFRRQREGLGRTLVSWCVCVWREKGGRGVEGPHGMCTCIAV